MNIIILSKYFRRNLIFLILNFEIYLQLFIDISLFIDITSGMEVIEHSRCIYILHMKYYIHSFSILFSICLCNSLQKKYNIIISILRYFKLVT